MAELLVFKSNINKLYTFVITIESDTERLDEPFTFPKEDPNANIC